MSEANPSLDHDPELSGFLDAVVELSAERHQRGPDAFLAALERLEREFRALSQYRTARAIEQRLTRFAEKRFQLIDEPEEYALAGGEVLVLSMALGDAAQLAVPALQRALVRLSGVLTEADVPATFGQILRRLRQLARQHGDDELEAWVRGVINALPSE